MNYYKIADNYYRSANNNIIRLGKISSVSQNNLTMEPGNLLINHEYQVSNICYELNNFLSYGLFINNYSVDGIPNTQKIFFRIDFDSINFHSLNDSITEDNYSYYVWHKQNLKEIEKNNSGIRKSCI